MVIELNCLEFSVMVKQSKKSIEQKLEELSQKKLELERLKKAEQKRFYSLIGFAIVQDSKDHNVLFEMVKKHIKPNDIELVKRKLGIKPPSPENLTQTGTENLSGNELESSNNHGKESKEGEPAVEDNSVQ